MYIAWQFADCAQPYSLYHCKPSGWVHICWVGTPVWTPKLCTILRPDLFLNTFLGADRPLFVVSLSTSESGLTILKVEFLHTLLSHCSSYRVSCSLVLDIYLKQTTILWNFSDQSQGLDWLLNLLNTNSYRTFTNLKNPQIITPHSSLPSLLCLQVFVVW